MPITPTHDLLQRLNFMLIGLGYELAPTHKPNYIEARGPGYNPGPYDRLSSHQYAEVHLDSDDRDIPDSLVGVQNQLYAWWDAMGYGILELTITQFHGPVNQFNSEQRLLTRTVLKLIEGEDALDNDAFNNFGRHWELLKVESSAERPYDQAFSYLESFLQEFDSSIYIEVNEDAED